MDDGSLSRPTYKTPWVCEFCYRSQRIYCIIIAWFHYIGSQTKGRWIGMYVSWIQGGRKCYNVVGIPNYYFLLYLESEDQDTIRFNLGLGISHMFPLYNSIGRQYTQVYSMPYCSHHLQVFIRYLTILTCYVNPTQQVFAQYIQNCPNDDLEILFQFLR